MKAVWFRFLDESTGKPTKFIGLAVAANMLELFWQIDQYGDPSMSEIKPVEAAGASFCVGLRKVYEGQMNFITPKVTTLEISDSAPIEYDEWDKGWKAPKWPESSVNFKP